MLPSKQLLTESNVRILHISDLHARGSRESEPWKRRRVLGPAWEDNLRDVLQDGPIDLLCFTGDAADRGKKDEYQAASEFFESLLVRLSLPRERLFLVPGNHDIDREIESDGWRRMRAALEQNPDDEACSRWLAGIKGPPLGFQARWREQVLARGAAYRHWVTETLRLPELDPGRSPHGTLGFRVSLRLPHVPCPIHIIGLDTAWLAGDDKDAGRLRLTGHQLMRLTTNSDGTPLDGLRLLLQHHPFSDLADASTLRSSMNGHVDLVLRGHLHDPEAITLLHPGQQLHQLAAGCLYDGGRADFFANSCQVITLRLNALGQISHGYVHFRSWSPYGGHWYDDNSRYKPSRDGRLHWLGSHVPPITTKSQATLSDVDPWTPAQPPRFVGRTWVLQRLIDALQERRSFSIVGDWRIGKSSLLKTWEGMAHQLGYEVFLRSGETGAGVSPAALVHAITGLDSPDSSDGAANVLEGWLGKRTVFPLILLDEADGPISRFDTRFFERLRGMLGKLCLVLASRRTIDQLYEHAGRSSPFGNMLQMERLGLLEPGEAHELLTQVPGRFSPPDCLWLTEWAGYHPFYLTLLSRHLLTAREAGNSYEHALDRFVLEASSRLRELWRWALTELEQRALRQCADGQSIPMGSMLMRSLRQRGLLTAQGRPFGRVLLEWIQEQA